jgi:hypothetical protein
MRADDVPPQRSVRVHRCGEEAASRCTTGAAPLQARRDQHPMVHGKEQPQTRQVQGRGRGVEAVLCSGQGGSGCGGEGSCRRRYRAASAMTLQLLACHALIGGADAAALSVDFCGYTTHYVKRTPSPSSSPPNPVPVVLVHGFGGSSGQWRASLDDLAASGRTVYAIDLLGFGASEKPQLPPYGGRTSRIRLSSGRHSCKNSWTTTSSRRMVRPEPSSSETRLAP